MGRVLLTLIMVACAGALAWHLSDYYLNDPWTRDGKVRADVVSIAPDVSGFVHDVFSHDNQEVKKGDLLFSLDKTRYVLALEREDALVLSARAALEMANKDLERYSNLDDATVTRQKHEQVVSTQLEASAAYRKALADQGLARLDLERTDIRAPVSGILSNFSLRPGNYVDAGLPVSALVDTDSFYVAGYFEENKLERIHIGDPVEIRLMGSKAVLRGHVQGVAAGIQDRERNDDDPGRLANVTPTFSWVRLAQRFPVRIHIDDVPDGVRLVSGRTASVAVIKD